MLKCRFCMTTNNPNIDLFDIDLFGKLRCLPIQVKDNDVLPKKICYTCERKFYDFYEFWQCVQDVEKQLLEELSFPKCSERVTPEPVIENISMLQNEVIFESETVCYSPSVLDTISTPTSEVLSLITAQNVPLIATETSTLSSSPSVSSAIATPVTIPKDNDVDDDVVDVNNGGTSSPSSDQDNQNPQVDRFIKNLPVRNKKLASTSMSSDCEVGESRSVFEDAESDMEPEDDHCVDSENNGKKFKCEKCSKIFSKKKYLAAHVYRVHQGVKVRCDICSKEMLKKSLVEHMKRHGDEQPIYNCADCPKVFLSRGALSVHLKQHRNQYIECEICGKRFTTKHTLQDHQNTHLSERQMIPCHLCAKQFSHKNSLRGHILSRHGNQQHQCSVCGKMFASTTTLNSHLLIHDNQRLFTCEFCGMSFNSKGSLRPHRYKHLNIIPYKCQQCGRGFVQSGNLLRHMRIHTGEKPFKCTICNGTFAHQASLKNHEKKH